MNSLEDEKIAAVLARLHREAEADSERWVQDKTTTSKDLVRMGDLYLGITAAEGKLLYLLARCRQARRIVEFGASYGISTLYLAAAARDNHGSLMTTEVHPRKCAAIQATIHSTGLTDVVHLLAGDARETLGGIGGNVDFVFLDGWKSLYLPVLNILRPKLRYGALIMADNITHSAAQAYCAAVRDPDSGFISTTLGQQELSYYDRKDV